jgi:hypothetical protein
LSKKIAELKVFIAGVRVVKIKEEVNLWKKDGRNNKQCVYVTGIMEIKRETKMNKRL